MRIKTLHHSAFTLLEVLLAAIIFVVTIGGLFVTLNAVRAPVIAKENALAATIVGQQLLNYLRSQVNTGSYYATACPAATPCTTLDLTLGPHLIAPNPTLQNAGIGWPAALAALNPNGLSYTVICASTGSSTACGADVAHQVSVNIISS